MHRTEHEYRAFGLRIRSALPLPELIGDESEGDPDARIVRGSVPADLPNASLVRKRFQATAGALLLRIEGVARYLVTGGTHIVVEPQPQAHEEDVRLFLAPRLAREGSGSKAEHFQLAVQLAQQIGRPPRCSRAFSPAPASSL